MPPKVLICIPCLLVGGTEMQTLALVRTLVAGGYTVVVCIYYEQDPGMVEAFDRAGARVVSLQLSRDAARRNLSGLPKLAWALMQCLLREEPQFVHAQYMAPGLPPLLVARAMGVPRVLATVHTPASVYGKRLWFIRQMVKRLCDAFLCVSEAAEHSFFGDAAIFDERLLASGRNHFTIPNAVDIDRMDAIRASTHVAELRDKLRLAGCVVVGMVSRLSPEKGPQYLVDAMAQVQQRVPASKLLLVGDGSERQSLVDQATRLNIADRIVWAGKLPADEAMQYLLAMDIVVAPSEFEGFGLSAAEAMAMGKPVVASDVGGLRDVVEDGVTGVQTPVGDVPAIASAIVRLAADAAMRKRMGEAGRRRVEQRFSMKSFADLHLHLYRAMGGADAALSDASSRVSRVSEALCESSP